MTVREILKMGDPRLLRVARAGRGASARPSCDALVADMFETMHAANGAGLAAPQIGVDLAARDLRLRAATSAIPMRRRCPRRCSINPTIEPLGDAEEEGWEGCLSVPGPARRRAALGPHPLPRLRRRRPADRARSRRLPCARRAARVRPPDRQALPDADARLQPLRLHERAVSGARRRRRRLTAAHVGDAARGTAARRRCKGTFRRRPRGRQARRRRVEGGGATRAVAGAASKRRSTGDRTLTTHRGLPHTRRCRVRRSRRLLRSPRRCSRSSFAAVRRSAQAADADPPARVGRIAETIGQVWLYSPDSGRVGRGGAQPAGDDRRPHRHRQRRARRDRRSARRRLRLDADTELEVAAPRRRRQVALQLHGGVARARVRDAQARRRVRARHRRRALSRAGRRPLSLRPLRRSRAHAHRLHRPGRSTKGRSSALPVDAGPARAVLDRRRRRRAVQR